VVFPQWVNDELVDVFLKTKISVNTTIDQKEKNL